MELYNAVIYTFSFLLINLAIMYWWWIVRIIISAWCLLFIFSGFGFMIFMISMAFLIGNEDQVLLSFFAWGVAVVGLFLFKIMEKIENSGFKDPVFKMYVRFLKLITGRVGA